MLEIVVLLLFVSFDTRFPRHRRLLEDGFPTENRGTRLQGGRIHAAISRNRSVTGRSPAIPLSSRVRDDVAPAELRAFLPFSYRLTTPGCGNDKIKKSYAHTACE